MPCAIRLKRFWRLAISPGIRLAVLAVRASLADGSKRGAFFKWVFQFLWRCSITILDASTIVTVSPLRCCGTLVSPQHYEFATAFSHKTFDSYKSPSTFLRFASQKSRISLKETIWRDWHSLQALLAELVPIETLRTISALVGEPALNNKWQ